MATDNTKVCLSAFDGTNVLEIASDVRIATADVSLPNGEFIRVQLDHTGAYTVTVGNYNQKFDGVKLQSGDLRNTVTEKLQAREDLRAVMLARQERIEAGADEQGNIQGAEWLNLMSEADDNDLFNWGESGGMHMSIAQRLAHMWLRLAPQGNNR